MARAACVRGYDARAVKRSGLHPIAVPLGKGSGENPLARRYRVALPGEPLAAGGTGGTKPKAASLCGQSREGRTVALFLSTPNQA